MGWDGSEEFHGKNGIYGMNTIFLRHKGIYGVWMFMDGYGLLWMVMDGYGWFWMVMDGYGIYG